jgi:hypothetical protein
LALYGAGSREERELQRSLLRGHSIENATADDVKGLTMSEYMVLFR